MCIEKIQQAGGDVVCNPDGTPRTLTFTAGTLGPELLENIAALVTLDELTLVSHTLDDTGLQYLGTLKRLRYLNLEGAFTGASLGALAGTGIASLRLSSPWLMSEHLELLSACPSLTVLGLVFVAIQAQNLTFLSRCTSLRVLELGTSAVDGDLGPLISSMDGLAELGLKGLKSTTRQGTMPDGRPLWSPPARLNGNQARQLLCSLANLRKLQRLDLSDWPLDDGFLDDLLSLPRSMELILKYTKLSAPGIAHLISLRDGKVVQQDGQKGQPWFSLKAAHTRWSGG